MVSLSRMLECGVVVNGLNAVDAETWKNYRAARTWSACWCSTTTAPVCTARSTRTWT